MEPGLHCRLASWVYRRPLPLEAMAATLFRPDALQTPQESIEHPVPSVPVRDLKVLGLRSDAEDDDVRPAFRQLAKAKVNANAQRPPLLGVKVARGI